MWETYITKGVYRDIFIPDRGKCAFSPFPSASRRFTCRRVKSMLGVVSSYMKEALVQDGNGPAAHPHPQRPGRLSSPRCCSGNLHVFELYHFEPGQAAWAKKGEKGPQPIERFYFYKRQGTQERLHLAFRPSLFCCYRNQREERKMVYSQVLPSPLVSSKKILNKKELSATPESDQTIASERQLRQLFKIFLFR